MSGAYATRRAAAALAEGLSQRDEAVLASVSELRFIRGDQLRRMHFFQAPNQAANARAARRALLRLTELDALVRLPRRVGGVRAGSAGFVYRLGLTGQRVAELRGWQPSASRRRAVVPGSLFVAHALAVAELHTRLLEAARAGTLELLVLASEPACWRGYPGGVLKPDSYVRLGVGEYEDSFFVEVDLGSEGSRTLDRKLREYLAYEASGIEQMERGVFPKTLWTVPDGTRASVIEACVSRLPTGSRELFGVVVFGEVLAALGAKKRGRNTGVVDV